MRAGEVRELPILRVPEPILYPGIQGEVHLPDITPEALKSMLQEQRGLVLLLAAQAGDPAVGIVARLVPGRGQFSEGGVNMGASGVCRGVLLSEMQQEPYLTGRVELHPDEEASTAAQALADQLKAELGSVGERLPWPARRAMERMQQVEDPGRLADLVMTWDGWSVEDKQQVIDSIEVPARLNRVLALVHRQSQRLEVTGKINEKVDGTMRSRQREQILREQLKAIRDELGEGEQDELADLRKKIEETPFTEAARKVAEKELRRLEGMGAQSPEAQVTRNYLDWLTSVPWGTAETQEPEIDKAGEVLAAAHYGLDKVKERILEYIAVRQLLEKVPVEGEQRSRTPILCLVGPPGVGKTSLGQAVAKALGRPFVRISLGGVSDEAEIRGHRRTYIGALPGRILQGMKRAGATNPVFLLDEIEKVGQSWRGDVSAALLEVLDPEQNHTFQDHYLEVPYDLSQVFFIATANMLDTLPGPLRDRLEIIEVPGYTEDEKLGIVRRHLLPKQLKAHGLPADSLTLSDEAVGALIRGYTMESGVRQLERELANLCRKRARRYASGETGALAVEAAALNDWLGAPKVRPPKVRQEDEVGVVTGVAYTGRGGDTLPIEVALMPGKGELVLTGQLGDVMQESARAALSVVRSRAVEWGIDPKVFSRTQIHLHVPAGAIPKDGPSAGITMATALLSAFTGRKVSHTLAMTGEITLRGKVLPIGGLKEKTLAALRAGCTHFILPQDNAQDLADITDAAREGLTFVEAGDIADVWSVALLPAGKAEHDTGLTTPLTLDPQRPSPPPVA